jgi:putative Mg2+ transporter-C (MgtC) family protein
MEWTDALRLLAAALAGAAIGLERELHDKPAGFRTNILICLGAALFTILSIRMQNGASAGDVTRIAAQVVTGVGFLGAGAIIQHRASVIGLTTAATIWAVASVGMAFGSGHYFVGCVATLLTFLTLIVLAPAEHFIAQLRRSIHLEIQLNGDPSVRDAVRRRVMSSGVTCRSWSISKQPSGYVIHAQIVGPPERVEALQNELMADEHVQAVTRA